MRLLYWFMGTILGMGIATIPPALIYEAQAPYYLGLFYLIVGILGTIILILKAKKTRGD